MIAQVIKFHSLNLITIIIFHQGQIKLLKCNIKNNFIDDYNIDYPITNNYRQKLLTYCKSLEGLYITIELLNLYNIKIELEYGIPIFNNNVGLKNLFK